MKLPIIGTSYAHGRTAVTARRAQNLWFEQRGDSEKAPVIATHLPGTEQTFALAGLVGLWRSPGTGVTYAHTATTIHRVSLPGGVNATQALAFTAVLPLEFANDSGRVLFVGAARAFHADVFLVASPNEIVIEGQSPLSCTYLGGYYFLYMASGRVYWSVNGMSWGPLDFANSESLADGGVKCLAVADTLVLIGQETIELWADTGNPAIPYRLIPGSTRRFSVFNAAAVTQLGDRVFLWGSMPGGSLGLFELDGTALRRLSNEDLDRSVGTAVARLSAFEVGGRVFVAIYSGNGATWWFDASLGVPSEITHGVYTGSRAYVAEFGVLYVTTSTGVSRMDRGFADAIPRVLVTDNLVTPDLDRFAVDKVRLDVQTETVTLEVSRDGGATWGAARSDAASADRGVRGAVQFDRYGTSSQFTFRISGQGAFTLSNVIVNPRN